MPDFVGWLREHNDQQTFEDRKCGFYGLDLYSLHASIEAVLAYWTNLILKRRNARGIITVASNILVRTSQLMDTRPGFR
jgi:erythromycin esterase-like protein